MKKVAVLVCVWLVSVCAAGIWAYGQAPQPTPLPPFTPRLSPPPPGQDEPVRVISGNDLGFRVDDVKSNRLVGRLVVRVNGQWREVEEAAVSRRLTER